LAPSIMVLAVMRIPIAALVICLVCPVFAADAPPEVEQALRARITGFNQLRLDHKFRQSEDFVAEDSKDYYYESRKPDLKAFKIEKIVFAPDFQTAVVTIHGKAEILIPPGVPLMTDGPYTDHWKLENGKWCWYIDRSTFFDTPFGHSAPRISGNSDAPPTDPTVALALSTAAAMAAHGALQADRAQIVLDANHPKPEIITLKNILPGSLTLKLMTQSSALKVSIARPDLGPTESTAVAVTAVEGSSERPVALVFKAEPLNQTISIAITWAAGQ
jgi:hypothetical protein